jgi:hypothetical protein
MADGSWSMAEALAVFIIFSGNFQRFWPLLNRRDS